MTSLPVRRSPPSIGRPNTSPKRLDDLAALATFINIDDRNKADFTVSGSKIEFTNRRTLALPSKDGTVEYGFSPPAFEAFCGLLDIPAKYLSSCPIVGRGSQQDQINERLSGRLAEEFLIRVRNNNTEEGLKGSVRTVLKADYSLFDNRHMVASVQRSLREIGGDFTLVSTNAQDPKSLEHSLHIRVTRTGGFDVMNSGDAHNMGFHAVGSEVGNEDTSVSSLVWRRVCSNGMMGWAEGDILKQRHRNIQQHELAALMQEAIDASIRQEEGVKLMLEQSMSVTIENPRAYIEMVGARRMRLPDGFIAAVWETFESDMRQSGQQTATRFSVAQAFTRAAQALPVVERVKVESRVGKFLLGTGENKLDSPPQHPPTRSPSP